MPQQKKRSPKGKPRKTATAKKSSAKSAAGPQQPKSKQQAPRMSQAMRARVRRQRLIKAAVIGAVVAILAAIVFSTFSGRREESAAASALENAGCAVDEKTDDDAGTGRNHREGVTYDVDPPAGGDHAPTALPPGRYDATSGPDDQLVHSLEHGYVIVWYHPDIAAPDLQALRGLQERYDRDTLLVERASLDVPVAITAWHKRALCPRIDAAALGEFVTAYRNKGPEKVPH